MLYTVDTDLAVSCAPEDIDKMLARSTDVSVRSFGLSLLDTTE